MSHLVACRACLGEAAVARVVACGFLSHSCFSPWLPQDCSHTPQQGVSFGAVAGPKKAGAWCPAQKGHIWAEPHTTMPTASGSPGRELLAWPWRWVWLGQPPGFSSAIPELVVALDVHLHSAAHSPWGKRCRGAQSRGWKEGQRLSPPLPALWETVSWGPSTEGIHHKAVSPVRKP